MGNLHPEGRGLAIEVDDVTAGYGRRSVLRNVRFAVEGGGVSGLIGPNGAGKTTMLRVLGGALGVASGRVRIGGEDLGGIPRRRLSRQVGFVPQSLDVPVVFSVEEFVGLGRTPYLPGTGRLSRQDRDQVRHALALTDTQALADRPLDELSAGEKQRVMVALALAQEPRILLLDEPTAHLDIRHAWSLMEMVGDLNRRLGVTVLVSSHDLNLAGEFCRHLILLEDGRVAAQGDGDAVLKPDVLSRVYGHPIERIEVSGRRSVIAPRRLVESRDPSAEPASG